MSKIIVRNMRLHPLIFSLILDRNVEKYIGCENKKLFTLIFFSILRICLTTKYNNIGYPY